MTTDNLFYTASKIIGNEKLVVKIKLNESCKNGYEYFSATCDGYERTSKRGGFRESFGGCAHDEIIKFFPELKIFTEVHLWSFGGSESHLVADGFYNLKNGFNSVAIDSDQFKQKYCDYYFIDSDQFEVLKDSENKLEFSHLLIELGIMKKRKEKAQKAIKLLEELTGKEFKSRYDKDKNSVFIDSDKLAEFKKLKREGFYSKENKQKRELRRLSDLKKSMIEKVKSDYNKRLKKANFERDIALEYIKQGLEVCPRSGNMKGAIYYTHNHTLNFNWSTEKLTEDNIIEFAKSIDSEKWSGLKITNDGKFLMEV